MSHRRTTYIFVRFSLLLLAHCQTPCAGLLVAFNLTGYVKSLDFLSEERQDSVYRYLSGNRVRLDVELLNQDQTADLKLITDHEFLLGSLLASQRTSVHSGFKKNEIVQLNWTLNEKENSLWRHRFYRAHLKLRAKSFDLTLGRQRIAWGGGRIWNPSDMVDPYNPLSVEKDERLGSDAIHIKWNSSDLSFIETVYVPQQEWKWEQNIFLGRAHLNFQEMDWSLSGGKREDEKIAGLDHAAQILEGSLRTALNYSFDSNTRRDSLKALVSYDYRFQNTLYILGEFYYNGIGEQNYKDYIKVILKPYDQQFFGKDYFGIGSSYEFSPLWYGECYGFLNLDDTSAFLGPRLRWQPITDLEFSAGYQAFVGPDRSEFGLPTDIAFFQIQYFFNTLP